MKKYWKSDQEYQQPESVTLQETEAELNHREGVLEKLNEVGNEITSRRNFLKFWGFSLTTAAMASSCENPIKKAIPYLNQPEEITPGMATYYATAYYDGHDYASLIAKVRDGRPIKLEGNIQCPLSQGSTTARMQASLLSLYDSAGRYHYPEHQGASISWDTADEAIMGTLSDLNQQGKKIILLTGSVVSPSMRSAIDEFTGRYPTTQHIMYDAISYNGITTAYEKATGERIIPRPVIDKARVLVSIGADFLGTWLNPLEMSRQYGEARNPQRGHKMLRHHQIESYMTLSGSMADHRYPVAPSQYGNILLSLYNALAARAGAPSLHHTTPSSNTETIAGELWEARGEALVLCGSNNTHEQTITIAINSLLNSYENTLNTKQPILWQRGDDKMLSRLPEILNDKNTGALITLGVNPVYDHPAGTELLSSMEKLPLCINMSCQRNETITHNSYICPDHHYLEGWSDYEPLKSLFSLAQPVIHPIYNTRQAGMSLLKWAGNNTSWSDYIKQYWAKEIFPQQSQDLLFQTFWDKTLQTGVFIPDHQYPALQINVVSLREAARNMEQPRGENELIFFESIACGDGRYADNPWLQELPDAISKVTWDNYAAASHHWMEKRMLHDGDMIEIGSITLPVLMQPGMEKNTLAIALGYGREVCGKAGRNVGVNIYPLTTFKNQTRQYIRKNITINRGSGNKTIARTQTHHSMEGRDIVRESTLEKWLQNPSAGNENRKKILEHQVSLYKEPLFEGHHWAMAIDLNRCTGCGACITACQAENNIPVTGRDEVAKRRNMQWLRIDRYFSGDPDNPEVVHMPVMCQHCDNAPCENVCPVAATMHSTEGLNQMAYNRCIGTKYCINNCPYKVRRFNWYRYVTNDKFDYHMNDEVGRMALNPDVVVRERGVVEKCSFCIQRIQEQKMAAKLENRKINDGDVRPACVQVCPSRAMIFGDLNDKNSEIAKIYKNPRNYHLLEELHTLPSVGYLTRIRNQQR